MFYLDKKMSRWLIGLFAICLAALGALLYSPSMKASHPQKASGLPALVGNVFPHMSVMATGVESDSEAGIGAMIPWADRLWIIGYVSHIRGAGIGLYEIDSNLSFKLHPQSITGTFANRLVHWDSKQAIIGPHIIDASGNVRTFTALSQHRLTATARHLTNPANKVYFLTMEGLLFEADVNTLETTILADLVAELKLPQDSTTHFKAAHSAQGRLVVANNTYEEPEFLGERAAGRLAEWDGTTWTILEENPFIEVSGKQNPVAGAKYGNTIFAVGWDRGSVILRVLHDGKWQRYLLPKGSQAWDHTWNTEWMRIREVQTERYLMDAFGIFYDLPPMIYGNHVFGIKPICNHLRISPDMTYWHGLFVLAGNQVDNAVGQPQSGLWFGNIDDLWRWGKPSGWATVWWDQHVKRGDVTDPLLMTGFDKKVLHLTHSSESAATFIVEVDFLGTGFFKKYKKITVPSNGYVHHEFPDAFSAHWVRVRAANDCQATVSFIYN